MQPHDDWRSRGSITHLVPALLVTGIGVLFLVNNLHIFHIYDVWRYWPVILIAVGLAKMVDSPFSGGRISGGVLMGVGAVCLADSLGFLSWADSWPLMLIGAGLVMLWGRLAPPQLGTPDIPPAGHEGTLNENAIFGGVDRKVITDDFRGGQISAVFGGVVIDLRRAGMRADSAVIDVNAIFGGVELKVPPDWIVVASVAAIFGGMSNKSVQPNADMPGVKRLYIKGAATFGGVDVKN